MVQRLRNLITVSCFAQQAPPPPHTHTGAPTQKGNANKSAINWMVKRKKIYASINPWEGGWGFCLIVKVLTAGSLTTSFWASFSFCDPFQGHSHLDPTGHHTALFVLHWINFTDGKKQILFKIKRHYEMLSKAAQYEREKNCEKDSFPGSATSQATNSRRVKGQSHCSHTMGQILLPSNDDFD